MQPRIPRPRSLLPGLLSVGGLLCLGHPGDAGAADAVAALTRDEPQVVSDAELTGRDIYERVLENRFDDFVQKTVLVSGARGDAAQESRLEMWWRDFQREEGAVQSKTLVRYTHPFDVRYSGYLIINNADRGTDQFVYLASRRRVRRVNLRGEAVFGTDFSFEDVVPRELDDSEYSRRPDEDLDGVACFVVEAVPVHAKDSEYSKFWIYIEKERYVPIRTRYWDEAGVENKELRAPVDSIRGFDGVHVPMKMTMRNLLIESYTTLAVEDLEPNTQLPPKAFDLRRLEGH